LVVDALNGAPGVISARYAGVGASDQDMCINCYGNLKVFQKINEARGLSVLWCLWSMLRILFPVIAQGVWEGRILDHPIGECGFGYDPVFWVPEHNCASAELSAAVKNSLSHRGQALRSLTDLIKARELS